MEVAKRGLKTLPWFTKYRRDISMKVNHKGIATSAVLAFAVLVGATDITNAQGRRRGQERQEDRQERRQGRSSENQAQPNQDQNAQRQAEREARRTAQQQQQA